MRRIRVLAICSAFVLIAACEGFMHVRGRVVDPMGNPVPYATVSTPATQETVQTDSAGQFDIMYFDSWFALGTHVRVDAAGFTSVRKFLRRNTAPTSNVLVLRADTTRS
ncbi:MAG TPA: carboxypeptidase regulatory-like domain-containing protein [Longimicrobium sp.]